MKTILYNPIFINPQAYYVFPRLTRYLQPDNESTAEPANYIGTIEVKVIAYGDTTLKRTYTNTDSIDLSEFKNTWIRISLFTKVGSCVLGEWKIGNMESDLPYIDPEVLASLKAVVIVGNKTNNDSDRAIVKNLVDPDNPFVISNAAYTEGSGYADKGSPYYGAFVTDGVEDLITSTKTVQEMGITDEVTVVSMIHQIDKPSNFITTNNIRTSGSVVGRNAISLTDKTGIYGWYKDNIQGSTINVINNILGDKADYTASASSNTNLSSKFSVVGYISNDSIVETSQVAWYWTIIANKVLTTDQINQVIAYFNLDRTLKPDILCDVKKQGITNENHAEFGDKLIDFSGNGRDIQLNNLAWDGDSGIGKYNYPNWKVNVTQGNKYARIVYYDSINGTYSANFKGITDLYKSYGLSIEIRVNRANTVDFHSIKEDGIYTMTPPDDTTSIDIRFGGENVYNASCDITITQIPSHAGALCLDGVNDFGKVTGMPVYKDYTVVTDREIFANIGAISSKNNPGAFVETAGNSVYSFGQATSGLNFISTRSISYLSKYSYCGQSITAGAAEDGTDMWLGTIRDNDSRFFNGAIYSLMSFPYSMSEFLIERQLKKHKLGTLYPDMVEFRPVIKANANYKITYHQIDSTNTWKSIKVGDYIVIGAKLAFQITFDNDASELKEVVSPQLSGIIVEKRPSNPGYNIYSYITSKSPQKINITIDEYIRFEDIVQPYPSLFTLIDYDTEEVYSWGSKLKVGARFKGDVVNLLPNMYEWQGNVLYNGEVLNWGIKPGVVAKEMVFSWNMPFKYLIDNNEPKVILSPRLLRIPNSSYKILGYIPDISGHGNHGVIHNSVYAKGSGVNEDGSYQFDGVNDFVTIPTLFSGGKQVLMKVNWDKTIADAILYDQRGYPNEFAIYNADVDNNNNPVFAYQARNNGQTYIDGILNKNIKASELRAITHNITITNELSTGTNTSSPVIGSNRVHDAYFTNMALYDFMLFDDISTDDKIKELNEYVGIEAKVELPPYYWDAYGKTNLDEDKATIQQRGVAVGDYDLTNHNHAYEGMSGYNGYPVVFGANKTWENFSSVYSYTSDVTSTTIHITRVKNAGTGLLFSYVKKDGALTNIREIPAFRVTVKGLEGNSKFGYRYLATEDATVETLVYLGNGTHELSKSFTPTEALLDLTRNAWVGIFITPMVEGEVVFDCDITIEVLPEYENGLVYDGVDDYSKNENIPVLTDYTIIAKRLWINKDNPLNEQFIHKGAINTPIGESAFMLEYEIANDTYYRSSSYGGYINIERSNRPERIVYQTSNSYNGTSITKGSGTDTTGIVIGGVTNNYWNGVFYKLMLYSKTLPLLQINYLKNLMEKDEIIDLNNKIFIQE